MRAVAFWMSLPSSSDGAPGFENDLDGGLFEVEGSMLAATPSVLAFFAAHVGWPSSVDVGACPSGCRDACRVCLAVTCGVSLAWEYKECRIPWEITSRKCVRKQRSAWFDCGYTLMRQSTEALVDVPVNMQRQVPSVFSNVGGASDSFIDRVLRASLSGFLPYCCGIFGLHPSGRRGHGQPSMANSCWLPRAEVAGV